jgi:hypothetical protein
MLKIHIYIKRSNCYFAKLDKDNWETITESEFMEGCMSKLNNL